MSGFAPIDASQNNLSRVGYGRDTPVTPHQNQRQVWETLASTADSNLTQWMFILNGNFSNKIDQVLMAISCYLNSAFSIRSTDGPDSFGWR
jgi:hypothetical protein